MLLPSGKGDDFYRQEFIRRYAEEKVVKDVLNEPAILFLRSSLEDKTPGAREVWKFGKAGHGESIPVVEDMLLDPYEVWLTPQKEKDSGQIRLAKRYLGFWKTKDKKKNRGPRRVRGGGRRVPGGDEFYTHEGENRSAKAAICGRTTRRNFALCEERVKPIRLADRQLVAVQSRRAP